MNSFDVFLPDYRTLTAESRRPGAWELFLFSADGDRVSRCGRFMEDSRDRAMVQVEKIAEAIALDTVNA